MRQLTTLMILLCAGAQCVADDDPPAAQPPPPRVAAPPTIVKAAPSTTEPAGTSPALFESQASWAPAGYNNEEIVYTIILTSHDTRILRCTTELKGTYFENGEKFAVADRQVSTVFPDQHVPVGNWLGMDEKSGATYAVTCRAI